MYGPITYVGLQYNLLVILITFIINNYNIHI